MSSATFDLPLQAEVPPLFADGAEGLRVGKSRVSLDVVVEQYESGMTPEDLVRAYDTLDLADVHAVISYYLRHRAEVAAYMSRRGEEAESLQSTIEAELPPLSRGVLLARRRAQESPNAAAGQ